MKIFLTRLSFKPWKLQVGGCSRRTILWLEYWVVKSKMASSRIQNNLFKGLNFPRAMTVLTYILLLCEARMCSQHDGFLASFFLSISSPVLTAFVTWRKLTEKWIWSCPHSPPCLRILSKPQHDKQTDNLDPTILTPKPAILPIFLSHHIHLPTFHLDFPCLYTWIIWVP